MLKACIVLVIKLVAYKASVLLWVGDEMQFQNTHEYP